MLEVRIHISIVSEHGAGGWKLYSPLVAFYPPPIYHLYKAISLFVLSAGNGYTIIPENTCGLNHKWNGNIAFCCTITDHLCYVGLVVVFPKQFPTPHLCTECVAKYYIN